MGATGEGFTAWAAKNSLFEGMSREEGTEGGDGSGRASEGTGMGGGEVGGRGLGGVLLAAGTAPTMIEEIVRVMREGGKGEKERRSKREAEGTAAGTSGSPDSQEIPSGTQTSGASTAQLPEGREGGGGSPIASSSVTLQGDGALQQVQQPQQDQVGEDEREEGSEEEEEEEEDSEELMADFIDEEASGSASQGGSGSKGQNSDGRKPGSGKVKTRTNRLQGARAVHVAPRSDAGGLGRTMQECRSSSWKQAEQERDGRAGGQLGKNFDRWHLGIGLEGVHPVASLMCCAR